MVLEKLQKDLPARALQAEKRSVGNISNYGWAPGYAAFHFIAKRLGRPWAPLTDKLRQGQAQLHVMRRHLKSD